MHESDIPAKANRILYLFLVALLLFLVRAWHLTTFGYERYHAFARSSQEKTFALKPNRGTIYDRFGKPLAVNTIQYNAAVCYSDLKQMSRKERKDHIEKLSRMLATKLELEKENVEDVIYSLASIFPNTPFVLKEDVSEELYYEMRMLEREWPGLVMQRASRRTYPMGKVGADVIGYMGAISDREYFAVAREMKSLGEFLRDFDEGLPVPLPMGYASVNDVKRRYRLLKERSYTINDHVGKSGIEAQFDEELRGFVGKKQFEVGMSGTPVRELPTSTHPIPGTRFNLAISAELQEYAKKLLAQSELERDRRFEHEEVAPPWIKGGAIVAMIPQTGEIVAMASYPSFDPNDFVLSGKNRAEKVANVRKWLETEEYIGEIWDGKRELEREFVDYIEKHPLTWDRYLDMILSKKGSLRRALANVKRLYIAISLQRDAKILLELSGLPSMRALFSEKLKWDDELSIAASKELNRYIGTLANVDDKLLFLDLLRLVADESIFTSELLNQYGEMSLIDFHRHTQKITLELEEKKEVEKKRFHKNEFALWRQHHFAEYLKEKRKEEKENNRYEKPYLEYLTKKEHSLFKEHWESLPKSPLYRPFSELTEPLYGWYPQLRNVKGKQYLKHLAASFYPRGGFGYGRSHAYRQATQLGSIFKIVTGFEALSQNQHATDLNPLTIFDDGSPSGPINQYSVLGRHVDGSPIHRRYKGGHLPRSHASIGRTTFPLAMQRSSNIYFSLLTEKLRDPTDLLHAAASFGFGKKTGIDLPYEYSGSLPKDLSENKSGLYAFAIGQHSFVATPLQTTSMLATLSGHGERMKPQIINSLVKTTKTSPLLETNYPFKHSLAHIGIHFPLFTEPVSSTASITSTISPKITSTIDYPDRVRTYLLDALHSVVWGEKGAANPYRIRSLYTTPGWHKDYVNLKHQLIGKTSTAERSYKPTLDRECKPILCKDIWFGGLSFSKESKNWEEPELAIIVYLRYGDWGKEAAPLAAQIIKKWRELQ